jgi:hypothetical protein
MLREYEILIDKIKELCIGKEKVAVYGPAGNELTVMFLSFGMSDNPYRKYTVIKLDLHYTRFNTLVISSNEKNFRSNISSVTFNVLKPKIQFDEFLKTALDVVKFILNAHNGGGTNTKLSYECVMDYLETLVALNNTI